MWNKNVHSLISRLPVSSCYLTWLQISSIRKVRYHFLFIRVVSFNVKSQWSRHRWSGAACYFWQRRASVRARLSLSDWGNQLSSQTFTVNSPAYHLVTSSHQRRPRVIKQCALSAVNRNSEMSAMTNTIAQPSLMAVCEIVTKFNLQIQTWTWIFHFQQIIFQTPPATLKWHHWFYCFILMLSIWRNDQLVFTSLSLLRFFN